MPPTVRWVKRREFVQMLSTIVGDGPVSPPGGWFHRAPTLYDYAWLCKRCQAGKDGISRDKACGPADLFNRLDRNHDGNLTPADFDWSEDSPIVRQGRIAERFFRRADTSSDGQVTAAEWQALFKQAARGKEALTPEDPQLLLFPPPPPMSKVPPPGMPSRLTLLRGLLARDLMPR
jgi:hypothetical protein